MDFMVAPFDCSCCGAYYENKCVDNKSGLNVFGVCYEQFLRKILWRFTFDIFDLNLNYVVDNFEFISLKDNYHYLNTSWIQLNCDYLPQIYFNLMAIIKIPISWEKYDDKRVLKEISQSNHFYFVSLKRPLVFFFPSIDNTWESEYSILSSPLQNIFDHYERLFLHRVCSQFGKRKIYYFKKHLHTRSTQQLKNQSEKLPGTKHWFSNNSIEKMLIHFGW